MGFAKTTHLYLTDRTSKWERRLDVSAWAGRSPPGTRRGTSLARAAPAPVCLRCPLVPPGPAQPLNVVALTQIDYFAASSGSGMPSGRKLGTRRTKCVFSLAWADPRAYVRGRPLRSVTTAGGRSQWRKGPRLKAPRSGWVTVDAGNPTATGTPGPPYADLLENDAPTIRAEALFEDYEGQVGPHSEPRHRRSGSSTLRVVLASDLVAICAATFCAPLLALVLIGRGSLGIAALTLLYAPVFLPIFSLYGMYRRARRRLLASIFPDLVRLVHALLLGCLLLLAGSGTLHALVGLPSVRPFTAMVIAILGFLAVPLARMVARALLRPADDRARVVIVGSGRVAAVVMQRLRSVPGMNIVGYVDDGSAPALSLAEIPKLGGLNDLRNVIHCHDIGHVIVAFSPASGAELADFLRSLADEVKISIVPRLFDLLTVRSHVDDLHGLPVMDVAPAALGTADRFAKRALDIAVALAGLLFTLPLSAVIACLVKMTSRGPVLFRQHRVGRRGHEFSINKFRTMHVGAESLRSDLSSGNEMDGPIFKLREDPRVTPLGAFLRRTSLDEIPQLVNVLLGDMSLVGPRPFIPSESAELGGWAARRFAVRPGITGLWQISGRSDLPFEELRRLDYSYVASWSLAWDLRILWHTPAAVLRRRGAY